MAQVKGGSKVAEEVSKLKVAPRWPKKSQSKRWLQSGSRSLEVKGGSYFLSLPKLIVETRYKLGLDLSYFLSLTKLTAETRYKVGLGLSYFLSLTEFIVERRYKVGLGWLCHTF